MKRGYQIHDNDTISVYFRVRRLFYNDVSFAKGRRNVSDDRRYDMRMRATEPRLLLAQVRVARRVPPVVLDQCLNW